MIVQRAVQSGRSGALAVMLPGMLLTAVLTIWRFDSKPLWRDEYFTYGTVNRDLSGMASILNGPDVGLSGYYALMQIWMLLGDSSWWLRVPGALAALAATGADALLGRRLAGAAVGASSGLLLAVTPALYGHAQEARPYPFILLSVAVVAMRLLRSLEAPTSRRRLLVAAAAVLPVLVHPLPGVPAVAGMFLGALFAPQRERRATIAWMAVPAAVIATVLVVAGFLHQAGVDPGPRTGITALISFHRNIAPTRGEALALALFALAGLVSLMRRRGPWEILVAWCVVPCVLIGSLGLTGSYFQFRYVSSITPAAVILASVGVMALSRAVLGAVGARPLQRCAAAAVPVVALALVVSPLAVDAVRFRTAPYYNDDPRNAVLELSEVYRPGEAVVFFGSTGRGLTDFYLPSDVTLNDVLLVEDPLSSGTLRGVEVAASQRRDVLAGHKRVWMVGTVSRGGWPDRALATEVTKGRVLEERLAAGGFAFECWVRGPETPVAGAALD